MYAVASLQRNGQIRTSRLSLKLFGLAYRSGLLCCRLSAAHKRLMDEGRILDARRNLNAFAAELPGSAIDDEVQTRCKTPYL